MINVKFWYGGQETFLSAIFYAYKNTMNEKYDMIKRI